MATKKDTPHLLVDVTLLEGQTHTHAGRDYVAGNTIIGMRLDSAKHLEGIGKIKPVGEPYPAKGGN